MQQEHAKTHYFDWLTLISLARKTSPFRLWFMVVWKKSWAILRKKYKLSDALLEKARMASEDQLFTPYQGFVLALDKSVYKDFLVINCGDEGLRIQLSQQGLPLKYVHQIIPLTYEDAVFLENLELQKKLQELHSVM